MKSLKYKILLLLIGLLLSTFNIQAQNQDWTAESNLIITGTSQAEVNTNLSKNGMALSLEQIGYNSNDTTTFTITSISGNWNTQSHLGQIIYNIEMDNNTISGMLTITGTSEGVTIILSLVGDNVHNDTFEFPLDIETLNNL